MKASVTGGTGFIGRRLVEALAPNAELVRLLTRSRSQTSNGAAEYVSGDLIDPGFDCSSLIGDTEVLFHCAAELSDRSRMRALHVDGTRRLIDAAAGKIRHWVQLSSVGVYGSVRSGTVTENHPLAPVGEYEATKAEADRLVLEASSRGAFTCSILRPSIVFGPGMPNQSLYQLISMVARGWFFYVGAPGATANYVFVDNVVDALVLCANRPEAEGRTYVLSDDRTMERFVAAIAGALRTPAPSRRLPEQLVRAAAGTLGRLPRFPLTSSRVDALTSRVQYSSAAIEGELGFRHRVSVEDGVRLLVEDWQSRR